MYRLSQPGNKNPLNKILDNTKSDLFNFVDLLSGKTKAQYQYELIKLNKQQELIKTNLNSSLSNSPKYLNIIR